MALLQACVPGSSGLGKLLQDILHTHWYSQIVIFAKLSYVSNISRPPFIIINNYDNRTATQFPSHGSPHLTFVVLLYQVLAKTLIQGSGAPTAVAGPALQYMRIRALAVPASLGVGVCQAALLALKDSHTPVLTVAAGCMIDIAADIVLITVSHPKSAPSTMSTSMAWLMLTTSCTQAY